MTSSLALLRKIISPGIKSDPGDYAVVARDYAQMIKLYRRIKAKAIEQDYLERHTAMHLWIKGGFHLIFAAQSTYINVVERVQGYNLKGYIIAEPDEELEEFLLSRIRTNGRNTRSKIYRIEKSSRGPGWDKSTDEYP